MESNLKTANKTCIKNCVTQKVLYNSKKAKNTFKKSFSKLKLGLKM